MLNEQNCWLRPNLVSVLVVVIGSLARRLGLQTLVTSHHDVRQFREYADRIYGIKAERATGQGAGGIGGMKVIGLNAFCTEDRWPQKHVPPKQVSAVPVDDRPWGWRGYHRYVRNQAGGF